MRTNQEKSKRLNALGDRRVDFDGVRVVAFDPLELVAALQHPVEFVDHHGNSLMALVGFDHRVEIRSVNHDMTLRFEMRADAFGPIAFQFYANSHDAFLVSKQSLGFFVNEGLERGGQLKMDARDDYFVVVLAVHVSVFGLG